MRIDLLDPAQVDEVASATGGRADAVCTSPPMAILQCRRTATLGSRFQHHGPRQLSRALSADHVVYASSGAVYDGLTGAVSPATPVSPLLPYAISKLAAEHYIRFF